jgi:thiopurine S-methyltransferase
MNEEYWLDKWERQDTAFHQDEVNEDLRSFWQSLDVRPDETVFVPLCGKSRDVLWLRARGNAVVGVELSHSAVESFFSENEIAVTWKRQGSFDVAESDGIRILCGDVFDLTAEDLGSVTAVYDRAALVALPTSMRERYVACLLDVLDSGTRMLLVTLEYRQEEMKGPPFSVPLAEVERLYHGRAEIDALSRRSILAEEPHFAERGVTSLHGCAFRVRLFQTKKAVS